MRLARLPLVLLAALAIISCGDDPPPAPLLEPPAEGTGFQVSYETMAPPMTEIWKCNLQALPNSRVININEAESRITPGIHHQTLTLLLGLGDLEALEPGEYDCRELYDAYPALMEDAIQLYGAQSAEQSIDLGPGIVAQLPPRLLALHEIHYFNNTPEELLVQSYLNAYTVENTEVEDTIWGFSVRDEHLSIPARGSTNEWTRCEMTEDVQLQLLSSHTHELGVRVNVSLWDGETVGEQIYTNNDWHTPKLTQFPDGGMTIPAGTGFHFDCEFDNPTDEDVIWGFDALDEMCQIAIVFTPGNFSIDCEITDSSDGLHGTPRVGD